MPLDLLDPKTFADGHPLTALSPRIARRPRPVHLQSGTEGTRDLGPDPATRTCYAVDYDFQNFSSEPTIMIGDPAGEGDGMIGEAKMMLMMDPPQHTAFRKLIRSEFTRPAAADRGLRLTDLARRIVNEVIEKGECDFVAEVAGEMPSYVIAELMGLPLDDGRELYKLTETIHSAPESLPPGAGRDAVMKMFGYAMGVIAEKRARPADDLATRLLQAEVEGRRLTDPEFLLFFLLLIDAGGSTTRNLLSRGLLALKAGPPEASAHDGRPRQAGCPRRGSCGALRQPGDLHAPHGDPRHTRSATPRHRRRRQGGDVLQHGARQSRPGQSSTTPTALRPRPHAPEAQFTPSAADRTCAWANTWPASRSTPSSAKC